MQVFNLLDAFIVIAIILTVVFSELAKKVDTKNRLKGYRVFLPAFFSVVFAFLLVFGNFIESKTVPFWWAVIFGFSVFFYEAILKRTSFMRGSDERQVDERGRDGRQAENNKGESSGEEGN